METEVDCDHEILRTGIGIDIDASQLDYAGLERFTVEELSKPPFNLNLTVASFSYMNATHNLKILNSILESIDPDQCGLIAKEEPSSTLDRIMGCLKVLNYQPTGSNAICLRKGLEQGDPETLVPLLAWLLSRLPHLRTRAYLAKFLTKVHVPDEIKQDEEIDSLYEKYENLIESFKAVHKQKEELIKKPSLAFVKDDLKVMHHDYECLKRKLEAAKSQSKDIPEFLEAKTLARTLRNDKKKLRELLEQANIEVIQLHNVKAKRDFLQRQYSELSAKNEVMTPENLISSLQSEVEILRHAISQKYPNELKNLERKFIACSNVRKMNLEFIEQLNPLVEQIRDANKELETLTEKAKRLRSVVDKHPEELSQIRQQAALSQEKRENLSCKLRKVDADYQEMKTKYMDACRSKKKAYNSSCLAPNEGSDYKLRIKIGDFKEKREHLKFLEYEIKRLVKENQKLEKQHEKSKKKLDAKLSEAESKFQLAQDQNQPEAEATLLEQVMKLRDEIQMKTKEHTEQKAKYEQLLLGVDCQVATMRMKVESLKQEISKTELEYAKSKSAIVVLSADLQKAMEENLIHHGCSFREKLLMKVIQQERLSKELQQAEAESQEETAYCAEQARLWSGTLQLLMSKAESLGIAISSQNIASEPETEEEEESY